MPKLPSLDALGQDLVHVSSAKKFRSVLRPLLCFTAFWYFALNGWWIPPEDLAFIGLGRDVICGFNPRLMPVIAHDRAGFGGGLFSVGVLVTMIAIYARVTRSLVETLLMVGFCGFGAAIGVHYVIGYTNMFHVAPAWAGALVFFSGLVSLVLSVRGAGRRMT